MKELVTNVQNSRNYNYSGSGYHVGSCSRSSILSTIRLDEKNATNQNFITRIEKSEKQVNSFKNKQDVIFTEIKQHKGELAPSLTGSIETNLDGIGIFMRLQRNDSGHPTGTKKDRDEMFVNLRLFVPYCKQMYDLIDWLDQQHVNGTKIF